MNTIDRVELFSLDSLKIIGIVVYEALNNTMGITLDSHLFHGLRYIQVHKARIYM